MQVLFDINSDGQPLGRVTVELFDDVPVGSLRFYELAEGHEGISYQLSKFNEVGPVRPPLHARRSSCPDKQSISTFWVVWSGSPATLAKVPATSEVAPWANL